MGAQTHPDVLVVVGPTASGKSALALALAERFRGTIINMDAMQCYRDLHILTARPSAQEESRVPHLLYGVRDAPLLVSAGWWRDAALQAIAAVHAAGRLPILCGGTGMYLRTLTHGIADLPAVPDAARGEARAMLAGRGAAPLHAWLAERDPGTAATLRPSDSQRLARAVEILLATGRGLAAWRAEPAHPAPLRFAAVVVDPPPAELRAAIAARFHAMLEADALAEVKRLAARGLPESLPIMRAHGVPELAAHLRGELDLPAAAARAILLTGQYTKRQRTWWRHHAPAEAERTHTIHARIASLTQFPASEIDKIFSFVERWGLTAPQHHS